MRSRFQLSLLLSPLLVSAVGLSGCEQATPSAKAAPPPPSEVLEVEVVEVEAKPLPRWLPVTGNLVPLEDAQVASGAAGKVLETDAERGQEVKAGDVLVRLDGRISAAQASAARAQVEIARAQRDSARSDCDRSEALFKGGGVSISQHQRTLAGCATADAQLAAAEAQARLAQSNLADTQIRAPFDGVVAERMVSAGEYVGPASPVVRLISTGAMRLELTVPAQSAREVRTGQQVEFASGPLVEGEAFRTQVSHVGAALRTGSRDLVIEAKVDGREVPLPPGSFVNARVRLADAPLPVVPSTALRTHGNQSRLFVVVGGVAEERLVQVSEVRDGIAGILDGVQPGERVVARPGPDLRDGVAVK
ncbi:MAG TPA: efflux RND transporter periplasmic adaptor subunit [Myxococcaceae bacterium]|nr:efflux RND transporter periplasmic adaptor subunit [Myxococcaceae bacterium]